ncbi:hypothetical protein [Nocardia xishanensis]|uniref:hypothetical protein n=1 Tax=Nocardia xishanensis TaxID=238964 RepID=UPI000829D8FB|nr:hypothetical protein [Nocardia xishanensis]
MPTVLHEVMIDLFRHRPRLAAELLGYVSDDPLPEFDNVRLDCGDFPDIDPTEYRADAVVVLTSGTSPVLAVIIEVQLKPDPDKHWSWPVYLTTLRARLRCRTALLVLCPNERTADRCGRPIGIAPGCTLRPLVVSPNKVPVVTDAATATNNPELAVLSAIAHRRHPERDAILTTLVEHVLDGPNGEMYLDLVTAVMPVAARHFLESLMTTGTYEYKSDFARRYYARGKADGEATGEARALLTMLRARRIRVPDEAEARIRECTDADLLNSWVERAATAKSLGEVLDR